MYTIRGNMLNTYQNIYWESTNRLKNHLKKMFSSQMLYSQQPIFTERLTKDEVFYYRFLQ